MLMTIEWILYYTDAVAVVCQTHTRTHALNSAAENSCFWAAKQTTQTDAREKEVIHLDISILVLLLFENKFSYCVCVRVSAKYL